MIFNNIKIAHRTIWKNKTYSLLNLAGLAVSLSAFVLIGSYVLYELSYDRYHENADRIYMVSAGGQAVTPVPLAEALMADFPEVETATRLVSPGQFLIRYKDKEFYGDSLAWADERLFDVFSFKLLTGDKSTALKNPYSVVISEKIAHKYFGDENPAGKALNVDLYNENHDFTVAGVMKNIPENSYVKADMFASIATQLNRRSAVDVGWGNYWIDTFFLLDRGSDPAALEEKYPAWIESKVHRRISLEYRNIPLTDMHLKTSDLIFHYGPVNNRTFVYIFSAVALIILLISCINYINLSTAQATRRVKEVGVRKVVGANRWQLVRQFICESALLTFLSLAGAVLLTYLLVPVFCGLIGSEDAHFLTNNLNTLFMLVVAGLLLGIAAGSYPAFFIANYNVNEAIKGASSPRGKNSILRNVLVVFQFSVSVFLIIGTLVTANQLHFIRNTDLGFTKDRIVIVGLRDSEVSKNRAVVKQELLGYPEIEGVTFSTTIPMQINWHNSFLFVNEDDPENNAVSSHYTRVDYDYVDLFELEIVQGRNFQKELDEGKLAYIINERIAEQLGGDNPVGKQYTRGSEYSQGERGEIVGVVRDFHSEAMHTAMSPVTLCLNPGSGGIMAVKVSGRDVTAALSVIETVWKNYSSGYPFEYEFMDEQYDNMYRSEIRLGKTYNSFAVLAVFICCLGLFGLASFTAEQSTKEIGIRKVLGASALTLVNMFSWKFLRWVLIANVITWPAAYIAMNKWLQEFAYRVDLGWPVFILAAAVALAIAFLTVLSRTLGAVYANPADSLRYE